MFEWNASYLTGIGSIDAQHQTLFQIAGKLHKAMTDGQGRTVLASVLDRLVQYTKTHFAHEERLMRLHDYPHLAGHRAQHEALTKQVEDFAAKFRAGNAVVTVQVLQFLRDWLVNHINGSDQKYAPYLAGKAVA